MSGLRRLARRARAALHHTTPAERGRPIHHGPGVCTGCWTVPGREHGFSCNGGTR